MSDRTLSTHYTAEDSARKDFIRRGLTIFTVIAVVFLAVLSWALWWDHTHHLEVIVGKNSSVVAEVNRARARANYLDAIRLAHTCGITHFYVGKSTAWISYKEARSIDTDWTQVNAPAYPGDTLSLHKDRCIEAVGTPVFADR